MAVDDLWYRKQRGLAGERLKTNRHGRGKRWRCRYTDATGEPRTRFFERKVDAEAWEAQARTGLLSVAQTQRGGQSFREYAERWRLAREAGFAPTTRERVEINLRLHLYPTFGHRPIRAIGPTDVLEWLTAMVRAGAAKNSIRVYFEVLRIVLNAARADKVIPDSPTTGINVAHFLRGLSNTPNWVPTPEHVVALLDVVPARYQAAIWVGASQALRIAEALGLEDGRYMDTDRGEFHVVQQLRRSHDYGGFYLSPPKSGSAGTINLDPVAAQALADHVERFPPVKVELVDITSGRPERRIVPLLFTEDGKPISNQGWSRMWTRWRTAAGWPGDAGFHALRHFNATTLITAGVEPQAVQRHLRHATLNITLETYVGYWPRTDRSRGVVSGTLQAARRTPGQPHH